SGIGTNYPGIGAHESAGAVCLTLLAWLLWPTSWIAAVDNALSGSATGPDPSFDESQAGLTANSESPVALSALSSLFGLEMSFWQALAAARTALVLRGLLYPDPDDLSNPTFAQFLSVPHGTGPYPLLSMPSTDDGTEWPTSAAEIPATSPSPFVIAASPLTFLTG